LLFLHLLEEINTAVTDFILSSFVVDLLLLLMLAIPDG
jgi:hypothetical protein